jgi:G3E family GTPase
MAAMRFILIGGFLGAGKTTTIARLAGTYRDQGLKVGIVTNDQAGDLVDTHSLRAAGFDVGEVAGSCFCCNFNGLAQVVSELEEHAHPDIILAEPVGSCTDIVATVIQPLRHLHQGKFKVSPYGVILKPSHGKKILGNLPKAGFSAKAAYIFRKQLEEADFLIINRIDELNGDEIQELAHLLATEYPGVPQLRMSAKTGEGLAALQELLDQDGEFGRRILELDYDIYAAGEAELGWLNSRLRVKSSHPIAMDDLALQIVRRLQEAFRACDAEPAHLKTIVMAPEACAVANLVSSDSPAVLSRAAERQLADVDVIVNARVAMDPEELARQVESTVRAVCQELGAEPTFLQTQSFRPGRPNPTYRYADAV